MIFLKGKLVSAIGKEEAFKYFEHWLRMDFTPEQTNKQIRLILDAITERGFDVNTLSGHNKEAYLSIMMEEFIC
jgi:hypothetical protein